MEKKYIALLHKKLSGQISQQEAFELDRWLEADPSHKILFQQYQTIWDASAHYEASPEINLAREKQAFFELLHKDPEASAPKNTLVTRPSLMRRLRPMVAAAAMILVFFGVYAIYQTVFVPSLPDFIDAKNTVAVTNTRDRDSFETLPDGSQLWLKQGSVFRMDRQFNEETRTVYLHGELFIHVARNEAKPFIIQMENNLVTVLGTSFYLKADDSEQLRLSVEAGLVELNSPAAGIRRVGSGASVIYDKPSGSFLDIADQNPPGSIWKDNYLVFEDAQLSQVFQKLAVYFGVSFDIQCNQIAQMKGFTSPVQAKTRLDLDIYLKTIEKVYSIKIDEISPGSYKVHGGSCR